MSKRERLLREFSQAPRALCASQRPRLDRQAGRGVAQHGAGAQPQLTGRRGLRQDALARLREPMRRLLEIELAERALRDRAPELSVRAVEGRFVPATALEDPHVCAEHPPHPSLDEVPR